MRMALPTKVRNQRRKSSSVTLGRSTKIQLASRETPAAEPAKSERTMERTLERQR